MQVGGREGTQLLKRHALDRLSRFKPSARPGSVSFSSLAFRLSAR